MALNKSKDYCEVCGIGGVKYEQGGKFYDAQEREVNIDGKLLEPDEKPAKKDPKQQAAQSELEAQIEANLKG